MRRSITPPLVQNNKRKRDDTRGHGEMVSKARRLSKTGRAIRVFTWNINGIAPFLQQDITKYFRKDVDDVPKASLRAFLYRHNFPEVLFLQEVKINHTDRKTQSAVSKAVNGRLGEHDSGPDYEVHFTLPRDKHNARGFGGKVYGVCTIVSHDFADEHVSLVREVDWDLEGRVSVVQLLEKIALWNIYAVNGTENPYRDPVTGAASGTRHDRKLAFHKLLLEECRAMEVDGWSHIIAGDLNVAPARIDGHPNLRTWPAQHVVNRADFNEKFLDPTNEAGLRAIDVFRRINGNEKKFTYHPRGRDWGSSCDRVDLILASHKLWAGNSITDAGILDSPQERGPSDHVPLYVELVIQDE